MDQQNLFHNHKLLDDSQSIESQSIQSGSIIHLIQNLNSLPLPSFSSYPNTEHQLQDNVNSSRGGDSGQQLYRICYPGLNIEGVCKNQDCSAFNQKVLCPQGMGCFDLVEDASQVSCPICGWYFKPEGCVFIRCKFTWTGIKKKEYFAKPEKVCQQFWSYVRSGEKSFYPLVDEHAVWSKLKIYADSINKSNVTESEESAKFCGICLLQVLPGQ